LLLAGPALAAVSRHFAGARLTGVGHPERWSLLAGTLPLEAVWSGAEAAWAWFFREDAPLPAVLLERLAPFQLALVFAPQPHPVLLDRLRQGGIPWVAWAPSFSETGGQSVQRLQAAHLVGMGIGDFPEAFCLRSAGDGDAGAEMAGLKKMGPFIAVAPGSGHKAKNWPLAYYYEVTRALGWQHRLEVLWLVGPAEAFLLPYLEPLARSQDQTVMANQPLARVAAALAGCRLYLGGDSGLTHLAAAAGAPAVLALFGPTDPRVWAPPGDHVKVLQAPGLDCAPCARGREISCPAPRCLQDLTPEMVLAVASGLLEDG
jgi:heptosyltransferase-2